MREVTITFVKRFTNSDPALILDAREILARLTGVWRGTAETAGGGLLNPKGTSSVGSSRVDLQACKLEYSIVSPK